jgi:chromosome segregation ATPase
MSDDPDKLASVRAQRDALASSYAELKVQHDREHRMNSQLISDTSMLRVGRQDDKARIAQLEADLVRKYAAAKQAVAAMELCIPQIESAQTRIAALESERDRLREALQRAHDKLKLCVTAGVLRHDLNVFLSAESAALAGSQDEGGAES